MRILVVDDEPQVLAIISEFLQDCGYTVIGATNGLEGLNCLESDPFIDLIISDVRMPRVNGIEFLRAVQVRAPGTPMILITGHGDEKTAIGAFNNGACDYLKKPLQLKTLHNRIERIEAQKTAEKNLQTRIDTPVPETQGPIQNILIIEHDAQARHQIKSMLNNLNYRIKSVQSGEEALIKFEQELFSIVISNTELPGLDGIETLEKMKQQDPALIPIIITSQKEQLVAIRALELGIRHFLPQPFTREDLIKHVQNAECEYQTVVDQRLHMGRVLRTKSDLQLKMIERENYLENLINAAPFGIISTDVFGHILTFNTQAEELYGYKREEIIGTPFSDLKDGNESQTNNHIKTYHNRKDGAIFPVLMYKQDIYDDRLETVGSLYMIEDLSHRETLEKQLLQAERLSMLGQLAPRIAHEFKTPLQIISGNVEMANEFICQGQIEASQTALNKVPGFVHQLVSLIEQMLNLGKPANNNQEELDLNRELKRQIELLQPLGVVKYCKIQWQLSKNLPSIYGDAEQIEQAFRNLIVNAAQAMEEGHSKVLTISSRVLQHRQKIQIAISDTGPGMSKEVQNRIFQPFFTTKPDGKGTGLGLPIVKTILNRHGATCQVESQPGTGTTFFLTFSTTPQKPDKAVTN